MTQTRAGTRSSAGIALAASVAFLLCLASSSLKNTVQVFFVPMADGFEVSRASLAWSTSLFALLFAVASPAVGILADRVGPGRVLTLGTALAGVSFAVCGWSPTLASFVVTYGVVASVAYAMLSYIPVGVLVDEIFPSGRKGFFYGLLTNGTAAGFIVLAPLWVWLSSRVAWTSVFFVLAAIFLVVLLPVSLLLPQRSPRARVEQVERAGSLGQRLRLVASPTYLLVAGAFTSCGVTMAYVDVHLVPNLHDHRVAEGAVGGGLVVLGLTELVGALVAGRLSDSGRAQQTLVWAYGLRAVSLLLLAASPTLAGTFVFAALFGASFLATVVVTTMCVLAVAPPGTKGLAVGLMWSAHQIGATLSSQLGALSRDATGSYLTATVVAAACALVSVGAVLAAPFPETSRV